MFTKNALTAIEQIVEDGNENNDLKQLDSLFHNQKNNDIGENLREYFQEEIKYFRLQSAFGEKITNRLLEIIDTLTVPQLMTLQERIHESKNQSLDSITSMLSRGKEYNNNGLVGLGENTNNLKSIIIEYSSPQEKALSEEVSKRLENFSYKDNS